MLAAARGRGGGCGRVWSSGHARAVAETAGCRLGEAAAAGAGPDFSCAGELEQPLKALIGEVRSLSVVCVCISGSIGRVWSCGRSSFVLVVWGGSPGSGWRVSSILDFPCEGKISVGASFVSGCQSGALIVCLLACLLHQVSPRSSCSTVFPDCHSASSAASARARPSTAGVFLVLVGYQETHRRHPFTLSQALRR